MWYQSQSGAAAQGCAAAGGQVLVAVNRRHNKKPCPRHSRRSQKSLCRQQKIMPPTQKNHVRHNKNPRRHNKKHTAVHAAHHSPSMLGRPPPPSKHTAAHHKSWCGICRFHHKNNHFHSVFTTKHTLHTTKNTPLAPIFQHLSRTQHWSGILGHSSLSPKINTRGDPASARSAGAARRRTER